jgi:hypothetical protein
MSLVTVLIIVLVVLLLAGTPYTGLHPYGFWPSGSIGIVLLIVVILLLLGYFR